MTSAQEKAITEAGCEVRFDNLTRQLYATDASIYQIEPAGAAFPKSDPVSDQTFPKLAARAASPRI